ncbi:hypothetical protein GCM10017600_40670 [Streptosporangium carneum]|uniref:Uncharacterized protein n=1 Tax=Streptosporangium carneum TaxID=47481 RepID=A0A9W6MDZ0_9ACTN|nr:hypothetical protein GCM10017600_40670 [Streptosporangium carneum]
MTPETRQENPIVFHTAVAWLFSSENTNQKAEKQPEGRIRARARARDARCGPGTPVASEPDAVMLQQLPDLPTRHERAGITQDRTPTKAGRRRLGMPGLGRAPEIGHPSDVARGALERLLSV